MEPLKHECGVAMIRLRKPLSYYQEKYGTWMYGLNKLYLLMEKQHNRGQEGAGLAVVKLNSQPGDEYLFRERAEGASAIQEIFNAVHAQFADIPQALLNASSRLSPPLASIHAMSPICTSCWSNSVIDWIERSSVSSSRVASTA